MAKSNLQSKLDEILAKGITDVKALGIDLYDIIPTVRITNNTRRLGSAQDMNKALVKVFGTTRVATGKTPLFRISISRKECGNDFDIKNVLYHEILHCAPNCQDHQATWKSHAARVNAAYGLNVTTTKNDSSPASASAPANTSDVKAHIGKCFRGGNRTFKFTGFNSRPKNSCDITDVATGKLYVCSPDYILKQMKEHPAMFSAEIPERKASNRGSGDKRAEELIGKKVKNGPRGRKVFTVVSIDPAAGNKAVKLLDENGCEYTGAMGCVSRLVVVG